MTQQTTSMPAPGQIWRLHFGGLIRRRGEWVSAPEPFGCGRRGVLVLACGPKWITVADTATAAIARIQVGDWPRNRPQLTEANCRRAIRRFKARRALLARLAVPMPAKTLRRRLAALERGLA